MMRTAMMSAAAAEAGVSSDEEVPSCPLCTEELDATDLAVKACRCGYQVCLYCLHKIREQHNGKCPACRTPYEVEKFQVEEIDRELAAKIAKERAEAKRERERKQKQREMEKERERAAMASEQCARMNLKHARIVQRNLVYVIGLSLNLAREETLRRNEIFGRFGRIVFILVNRSTTYNPDAPGGPSLSAYVQFARDSDAAQAVRSMSGEVFDGRELRLAIGTTKYCEAYVKAGSPTFCGYQNCLHLHEPAPADDVLTREEVISNQLGPPPPAHLFQAVRRERTGLVLNPGYNSSSAASASTLNHSMPPSVKGSPPRTLITTNGSKTVSARPSQAETSASEEQPKEKQKEVHNERRVEIQQQTNDRANTEFTQTTTISMEQRPPMPWPSTAQTRSRFAPPVRESYVSPLPTNTAPPGFGPPSAPAAPAATSTWSTAAPPGFSNVAATEDSVSWPSHVQKKNEAKGELNDVLDRLGKTLGIEDDLSRDLWSETTVFSAQSQVLKTDRGRSRFGFAQEIGGLSSSRFGFHDGEKANAAHTNGFTGHNGMVSSRPDLSNGLTALLETASREAAPSLMNGYVHVETPSQPPPGFGVTIDPASLLQSCQTEQTMHSHGMSSRNANHSLEQMNRVAMKKGGLGYVEAEFSEDNPEMKRMTGIKMYGKNMTGGMMGGLHSQANKNDMDYVGHIGGRYVGYDHGTVKMKTVSELEREVEAARAQEAALQNKLAELQQRIRNYDSINT